MKSIRNQINRAQMERDFATSLQLDFRLQLSVPEVTPQRRLVCILAKPILAGGFLDARAHLFQKANHRTAGEKNRIDVLPWTLSGI